MIAAATKYPKVKEAFKAVCPALSAFERDLLERDVVANGCRDALCVWRGFVLDGHSRLEIVKRHGIAFKVREIKLDDESDAILWIIRNQLARRNLSAVDASLMRGRFLRELEKYINARAANREAHAAFGVRGLQLQQDRDCLAMFDKLIPDAKEFVTDKDNDISSRQAVSLARMPAKLQKECVDRVVHGNNRTLDVAIQHVRSTKMTPKQRAKSSIAPGSGAADVGWKARLKEVQARKSAEEPCVEFAKQLIERVNNKENVIGGELTRQLNRLSKLWYKRKLTERELQET